MLYMSQGRGWTLDDHTLDKSLYYVDQLHLIEAGNAKFAFIISNTIRNFNDLKFKLQSRMSMSISHTKSVLVTSSETSLPLSTPPHPSTSPQKPPPLTSPQKPLPLTSPHKPPPSTPFQKPPPSISPHKLHPSTSIHKQPPSLSSPKLPSSLSSQQSTNLKSYTRGASFITYFYFILFILLYSSPIFLNIVINLKLNIFINNSIFLNIFIYYF